MCKYYGVVNSLCNDSVTLSKLGGANLIFYICD